MIVIGIVAAVVILAVVFDIARAGENLSLWDWLDMDGKLEWIERKADDERKRANKRKRPSYSISDGDLRDRM